MKQIFIAFLLLFAFKTFSQSDTPMPDSATVVSFPWYDNSQFLEDYLEDRGYFGNPIARTNCPVARYHIPVRVHIYRNNNGGVASNISQNEMETIFGLTNDINRIICS